MAPLKEQIDRDHLLTQVQVGTQRCPKCKKIKAVKRFHKDSRTKSGYNYVCKVCRNARNRRYKQSSRTLRKRWEKHINDSYGITGEEYDKKFKQQAGLCEICERPPNPNGRRLAVDHNHTTGKVRGLLCSKCNQGIGHLNDSIDLLNRCIEYLYKYDKE